MKAKLIKTPQGYYLEEIFEQGVRGSAMPQIFASTYGDGYDNLSLKNCQAIENGYDLERTADMFGSNVKGSVDYKLGANYGFEKGFQYALEILGDRKFTEDNMNECWDTASYSTALHRNTKENFGKKEIEDEKKQFLQSLQQNEWEVEIVREDNFESDGIEIVNIPKPKLDADGRLILKRV